MPRIMRYETMMQKPDTLISPARMLNLAKIINTIGDDTVTYQQLTQATMLQSTQINDAICQRGMRKLITGEDVGFKLSNYGLQVLDGTLKLEPWGIDWSKAILIPTSISTMRAMTLEEYKSLDPDRKSNVNKANNMVRERAAKMIITFDPRWDADYRMMIARAMLWQFEQVMTRVNDKLDAPQPSINPA